MSELFHIKPIDYIAWKFEKMSPAAKLELVTEYLGGQDILDDDGEPTGEKTVALITPEEARKLLGFK